MINGGQEEEEAAVAFVVAAEEEDERGRGDRNEVERRDETEEVEAQGCGGGDSAGDEPSVTIGPEVDVIEWKLLNEGRGITIGCGLNGEAERI